MATTFIKDPSAILDYTFDWSGWLATGETISSYTVTADTGITAGTLSEASGVITYWLTGGTNNTIYNVVCKVVTSAGRTDERTAVIRISNR